MAPGQSALVLTPSWQNERLLLVRPTDALRLCRDGGYEKVPRHQTAGYLTESALRDRTQVRDFIQRARITSLFLCELDDLRVFALLRKLIQSADLVVVREGAGDTKGEDASLAQQRKLVRAIESRIRPALNHEGRTYRLIADMDLGRLPNRDRYEVASQDEAIRLLDALAKQADPSLAGLLGEVRGRLARDWRPPLSPDGLVLLRRIAQHVASVAKPEPALTPSQLKKLRASEWGVAPVATHEEAPEIELQAERENPFELETGAEVEPPPEAPADSGDEIAA